MQKTIFTSKITELLFAVCILLFSCFVQVNNLQAQDCDHYRFSTTTSIPYTHLFPGSSLLFTGGVDDAVSSPQNIGFSFNYCGIPYDQFIASSNGFIYLGNFSSDPAPVNALGSTLGPVLAPFWDNLVVSPNGKVLYRLSSGLLEIEYQDMMRITDNPSVLLTFKIRLYQSGIIEFQYNVMNNTPGSSAGASIGIANNTMGINHFLSITETLNPILPTFSNWFANDNNTFFTNVGMNNITYEFLPYWNGICEGPNFIVVDNVTATTAKLNWQLPAPPPASFFDIYYSTSAIDPNAITPLHQITACVGNGNPIFYDSVPGTATYYTMSNLTPNTTYYVFIRSNCGICSYSNWMPTNSMGLSSFQTTVCNPIVLTPPTNLLLNNDPEKCSFTGQLYASKCFPPLLAKYEWDFDYVGSGFFMRKLVLNNFTQCVDPPMNIDEELTHTFGSHLDMEVSTDFGGLWVGSNATGMAEVKIKKTVQNGSTEYYDTEMLQLNLSGGTSFTPVMIRESPTRASLGNLKILPLGGGGGGGGYMIDSFFDIFIEVSTDGGTTWVSVPNSIHMQLITTQSPAGPVVISDCSPTVTVVRSDAPAKLSDPYPIGQTTIVWTATDAFGASVSSSNTVTVIDNEFPSISCVPSLTVSNNPGLCSFSGSLYPTNCLPPLGSAYQNNQMIMFYNGMIVTNIKLTNFSQCIPPPTSIGIPQFDYLLAESFFDVYTEMGIIPVHASGPVTVSITKTGGNSSSQFYDTEMTQLGLNGEMLTLNVMIRESPTKASLGKTNIIQNGVGGGYQIDSFFDIWIEVSVDGGNSWTEAFSPIHMVLINTQPLAAPLYHDNCSATLIGIRSDAPTTINDPYPVGTTTVIWTVTDASGNSASCSNTVTVVDTEPPVISCAPSVTVNNDPRLCSFSTHSYATNCYPPLLSKYEWDLDYSESLLYMRNPVLKNFTQCTPPPEIIYTPLTHTFGSQVEMEVSMDGGMSWLLKNAQATMTVRLTKADEDGSLAYYDTEILQLDISGGNLPQGVMIRESPTRSSHGTTIIVSNGTDNDCDSFFDIYIEVSTDGGQTWTEMPEVSYMTLLPLQPFAGPIYSDNCTAILTAERSDEVAINDPYPVGTTTITWTVTDPSGNSATCTNSVTVIDTEPPLIVCPPNIVVSNDPGHSSAQVSYEATASDQCDGTASTLNVACLTVFPPHTINPGDPGFYLPYCQTVNCPPGQNCISEYDNNGNLMSCHCDYPISLPHGLIIYSSPASGYSFPIGTTTVTVTAIDAANNVSTNTFTVTVIEQPPISLNCPANVVLPACTPGVTLQSAYNDWLTGYTVTGGCNVVVTNDAPLTPPHLCGGSVTVTWTAVCSSVIPGCSCAPVSCSANFTVLMPPPAHFDCLPDVFLTSCMTQETLIAAYNTFIETPPQIIGGCYYQLSPIPAPPPPPICGGSVTFSWVAFCMCGEAGCTCPPIACTRTFLVNPQSAQIINPNNIVIPSCTSAANLQLEYDNWLASAHLSGCYYVMTNNAPPEPPHICGGTVTVTWTAHCTCGDTIHPVVTHTATFTVAMAPPAQIICATDVTLPACTPLEDILVAYQSFATTPPQIFGGCFYQLLPSDIPPPPHICGGTVTLTWTAVCMCGDPNCNCPPISCSRTFTIQMPPPAHFNCAQDLTLPPCTPLAEIQAAYTSFIIPPEILGGCYYQVLPVVIPPMPHICGGSITITWIAQCMCGEPGCNCPPISCTRTFTIQMPPPAHLSCVPNVVLPSCTPYPLMMAAYQDFVSTPPQIFGGCYYQLLPIVYPPPPPICGGTVTLTWTAECMCGVAGCTCPPIICSASFTIEDAPEVVFSCAVDKTEVACQTQAAINASFDAWLLTTTASGGCNGILSYSPLSIPSSSGGSVTVNWIYTSDCNDAKTCSATFTVLSRDTVPPEISCPANASRFTNTGFCTYTVLGSEFDATVTDNCGAIPSLTFTLSGATSSSGSSLAGMKLNKGNNTIVWTALDYGGNTISCSFTVLVYDDQNSTGYIIYATTEAKFGENNTINGDVGVTATTGKAEFKKNDVLNPYFVKASIVNVQLPSSVSNVFTVPASGGPNPPFLLYVANPLSGNYTATVNGVVPIGNYKNLTIKKNIIATVNGSNYGKITIEEGAKVSFSSSNINIEELIVGKGKKNVNTTNVYFTAGSAAVKVKNKVTVEEDSRVNVGGPKVTFYLGDNNNDEEKFIVNGDNTQITLNIMIPNGKLSVEGKANNTILNGWFIIKKLESKGKFVTWNNYDCSSTLKSIDAENKVDISLSKTELLVYPNPTPGTINFKFRIEETSMVRLDIFSINGKFLDCIFEGEVEQDIEKHILYTQPLPEGMYLYRFTYGAHYKAGKFVKILTNK
ncbi:MAG: HYR domain-containing protein [Bacteroidota bacterium]